MTAALGEGRTVPECMVEGYGYPPTADGDRHLVNRMAAQFFVMRFSMLLEARYVLVAVLVGLGATALIDLWALFLRRAFGVRSLDYCLLGRWLLHIPDGTIVHHGIASARQKRHECVTGWIAHYSIGATFALVFLLFVSARWLERPTPLPALAFGVVTTLVPFFIMQPALGLGWASSKAPKPNQARLKSLATHTVFGLGLYLWALLLSRILFRSYT